MPLVITDEILEKAGIAPEDARIEVACLLFGAEKLALWPAAQLAGLSRVEFEDQLRMRRIPLYRPTSEDLDEELAAMERLGVGR